MSNLEDILPRPIAALMLLCGFACAERALIQVDAAIGTGGATGGDGAGADGFAGIAGSGGSPQDGVDAAVPVLDASATTPGPRFPRRLIVVGNWFGWLQHSFIPEFDGGSLPTNPAAGWDYRFDGHVTQWSRLLAPLNHLSDQVTVIDGLTGYTHWAEYAYARNPAGSTLTGRWPPTPYNDYLGPSIDWEIAKRNRPVAGLPIVVSTGARSFTFGDEKDAFPYLATPLDMYHALYDGVPPECAGPKPPNDPSLKDSAKMFTSWWNEMVPVVVGAFRCDRTRVFSLVAPGPELPELGVPNGGNLDQDYNDQSGGPEPGNETAKEIMKRYAEMHASRIGELALALRLTPEGDGSMLDHTIIMWVAAWPDTPQNVDPWKMILIGGSALGMKTGRYVYVKPTIDSGRDHLTGPPHNQALAAVGKLFGLEIDAFGDTSVTLLRNGKTIDLRGVLPEISGP